MDELLKNIGIVAIMFVIIYVYKKLLEYNNLTYTGIYENDDVYKAAAAFVHDADLESIKVSLTNRTGIDMEEANKIIIQAVSHHTDKDGGYCEFIKAVNHVFGSNIYNIKSHKPERF
ncbi:MAG TPA: hypothetical protein DC053_08130 [Lachnoclostridium sp.]|nr:hypothetical protein [Lachnoclostridium sp.]